MNDDYIAVRNLTDAYKRKVVLDDITLGIKQGELFGILGPNGSGKSTMLRILSGLRKPLGGSVSMAAIDVNKGNLRHLHRLLGITFQTPSLDEKLSIRQNLSCQAKLFGVDHASQRIDDALMRMNLKDRQHDLVEKLSGGLKRRVELAKIMLNQPKIMLLDEPSTGLDPAARNDFWQYIKMMRTEHAVTIVLSTHIMEEAEQCDRVAFLAKGRLLALDKPAALLATLSENTLQIQARRPHQLCDFLRNACGLEAQSDGQFIHLHGLEDPFGLATKINSEQGDNLYSIRIGRPTLNDVFIKLAGSGLDGLG